nr:hypothetical protein Itr_chr15CG08090 [Ipomoea trifida]
MRCINEDKSVLDEDKDIVFIAATVKSASQLDLMLEDPSQLDLMFSGLDLMLEDPSQLDLMFSSLPTLKMTLRPCILEFKVGFGAHKADHGVNST